jgi:type I site-specific restriction endonuclease
MFRSGRKVLRCIGIGLVLAGLSIAIWVQAQPAQPATTQGIYTCVDARGRKLTSDRPIAECTDREQKVLNPSGTLKAKVGPTLTSQERAQLEAREKAELEEQARLNEEKRRDRALLTRYPVKAVHDNERAQALAQIGVVRQASVNRVEELQRQRKILADEMEFYKKDPNKAPPSLRRQVDEVAHSLSVQARFIADQDAELQRVNARFDEELARLNQLWAMQSPLPGAATKKR